MPVYLYEVVGTGEQLEITHSMQESAHTADNRGRPIRKLLTAPNLGTRFTEGAERKRMSNENIERLGFSKYTRDKLTGRFHKEAGKGPAQIAP